MQHLLDATGQPLALTKEAQQRLQLEREASKSGPRGTIARGRLAHLPVNDWLSFERSTNKNPPEVFDAFTHGSAATLAHLISLTANKRDALMAVMDLSHRVVTETCRMLGIEKELDALTGDLASDADEKDGAAVPVQ